MNTIARIDHIPLDPLPENRVWEAGDLPQRRLLKGIIFNDVSYESHSYEIVYRKSGVPKGVLSPADAKRYPKGLFVQTYIIENHGGGTQYYIVNDYILRETLADNLLNLDDVSLYSIVYALCNEHDYQLRRGFGMGKKVAIAAHIDGRIKRKVKSGMVSYTIENPIPVPDTTQLEGGVEMLTYKISLCGDDIGAPDYETRVSAAATTALRVDCERREAKRLAKVN